MSYGFNRTIGQGTEGRGAVLALGLAFAAGVILLAGASASRATTSGGEDDSTFTSVFPNDRVLSAEGVNYFWGPVTPGYREVLSGRNKQGQAVVLTITATRQTKFVDGVETRIVEERVTTDGVLSELAENYEAVSPKTNSVYYFGEFSSEFKNGRVDHGGSWIAGEGGAQHGMLMPGVALLGARFMQEVAPGVALDRSEIIADGVTINTPAGTFTNCLTVHDSDGLNLKAGPETKTYCPGIGIVQDETLFLTSFGRAP